MKKSLQHLLAGTLVAVYSSVASAQGTLDVETVTVPESAAIPTPVHSVSSSEKESLLPKSLESFLFRYSFVLLPCGGALTEAGIGVGLHSAANNRFAELRKTCGYSGCSESDISSLKKYYNLRDATYVTAGVTGAVAVGLLLWDYFNNPRSQEQKTSAEK